ncbi:MAG: hypothetical protein ACXWUP_12775, partial [Allosphingosinicella sp.]
MLPSLGEARNAAAATGQPQDRVWVDLRIVRAGGLAPCGRSRGDFADAEFAELAIERRAGDADPPRP